jgi:hypothetical protein
LPWSNRGWLRWLLDWAPAILLPVWLVYWLILHRTDREGPSDGMNQANAHLVTFAVGYCWVTAVAILFLIYSDRPMLDALRLIQTILFFWVPAIGGFCVVPLVARWWRTSWLGSMAIMAALAVTYVGMFAYVAAGV